MKQNSVLALLLSGYEFINLSMEPTGKPVTPLQMPFGGEHPTPEDRFTDG